MSPALRKMYGHAEAQANLGMLFAEQVPPNLTEAHKWVARAAQQGIVRAQVFLGIEYAGGRGGVTQDYIEAHKWLNLAAARSEEEKARDMSTALRDKVAAKMTAEQIAVAQKLAREWAPKLESRDFGHYRLLASSPSRGIPCRILCGLV